jgi:hypothetical protein
MGGVASGGGVSGVVAGRGVLFIGHSANPALPSAALGNVLRSVKS